ncbi:hypothetical protein PU724_33345, partial [Mesorhizobium abyssinicae]
MHDRLFTSTNYTAPSEEQPTARTKDGKSRGLPSRVKTRVGRVFAENRGEKSSGGSVSEIHPNRRMYYAKRRSAIEPFESDKVLVSRFMRASAGSAFMQTAQRNASHLESFSAWLNERERDSITDRLTEHGLKDDAREYAEQVDRTGSKNVKDQIIEALENLRQSDLPAAESTDDERLIAEFREAAESAGRARNTVGGWVTSLHKFRTWLRPTNLTLSSLLDRPDELNRLATLSGTRDIHAASTVLQEFHAAKVEERAPDFNPHRRQRLAAPPAEDAALMKRFKTAAKRADVPINTIDSSLIHAKKFANWLHENNKEPLASRFRNEALADDIEAYRAQGNDPENRLLSTLTHLRRLLPGGENIQQIGPGPRLMGRRTLDAYPDDAEFIDLVTQERLSTLGPEPTAKQKYPIFNTASVQRRFSDWLQREKKGSIVSRLKGDKQQQSELMRDVKDFKRVTKNTKLRLDCLSQYLQVLEANRALSGMGGVEQAGREPWPTGSNLSWSPQIPSDFDPRMWPTPEATSLQAERHESAGSGSNWSPQTPSDFDPRMWPTPEATSLQAERQEPAGSGSNWSPQTPSDFDPRMWPTPEATSVQAERQEPAGSGSNWSPQIPSDFDATMWPTPESTSARSSDIYRGLDSLVDLPSTPAELRDDAHYAPPPGTASDAQVKALDPQASSHDRSGLALDATQWLGDRHIQRDYELLAQELQRDNPDLASRTRLVDPLIAHYHLRLGSDNATLGAFQR